MRFCEGLLWGFSCCHHLYLTLWFTIPFPIGNRLRCEKVHRWLVTAWSIAKSVEEKLPTMLRIGSGHEVFSVRRTWNRLFAVSDRWLHLARLWRSSGSCLIGAACSGYTRFGKTYCLMTFNFWSGLSRGDVASLSRLLLSVLMQVSSNTSSELNEQPRLFRYRSIASDFL